MKFLPKIQPLLILIANVCLFVLALLSALGTIPESFQFLPFPPRAIFGHVGFLSLLGGLAILTGLYLCRTVTHRNGGAGGPPSAEMLKDSKLFEVCAVLPFNQLKLRLRNVQAWLVVKKYKVIVDREGAEVRWFLRKNRQG